MPPAGSLAQSSAEKDARSAAAGAAVCSLGVFDPNFAECL